jgi:hypothetical protein
MLWNALPPRFGCSVSLITGQHSPVVENRGREQVEVKVE